MKWVTGVFWWLAGFVIVPFLCLVTPSGARHWRYLDSIYGNRYDPLDGDLAYRARVRYLCRFRWSQLRNPVNNLLRSYGPDGTVEAVDSSMYSRRMVVNGKEYTFKQVPIFSTGLYLWLGYKLIDDWRLRTRNGVEQGSRAEVGCHFDNQMILWPIKNKAIILDKKRDNTAKE